MPSALTKINEKLDAFNAAYTQIELTTNKQEVFINRNKDQLIEEFNVVMAIKDNSSVIEETKGDQPT